MPQINIVPDTDYVNAGEWVSITICRGCKRVESLMDRVHSVPCPTCGSDNDSVSASGMWVRNPKPWWKFFMPSTGYWIIHEDDVHHITGHATAYGAEMQKDRGWS